MKLPSRLVAKRFLFRCIYKGPAYAYASDDDFSSTSTSVAFWQNIIDTFFYKYKGLNRKHIELIHEATLTGRTVSPFGRIHLHQRTKRGEWDIPAITNHINQGVAADVMAVARVSFAKRFKQSDIKGNLISTVHDSIVCDVEDTCVNATAELAYKVFTDLPSNISRMFNINWNVPLLCEVGYGPNMKDLTVIPEIK